MAQSIGSIHRCIEQLAITQIQEHISHNQESNINLTFLTIKNKFLTISSPSVPNPRTHIHHHPYTKNQEHISQSHHHASDNNTEGRNYKTKKQQGKESTSWWILPPVRRPPCTPARFGRLPPPSRPLTMGVRRPPRHCEVAHWLLWGEGDEANPRDLPVSLSLMIYIEPKQKQINPRKIHAKQPPNQALDADLAPKSEQHEKKKTEKLQNGIPSTRDD